MAKSGFVSAIMAQEFPAMPNRAYSSASIPYRALTAVNAAAASASTWYRKSPVYMAVTSNYATIRKAVRKPV
jgi:hypothetical protein